MCFFITTYRQYSCGHEVPELRQWVDCNQRRCRSSQRHDPTEHSCPDECTDVPRVDQHLVVGWPPFQCNACRGIHTANGNGNGATSEPSSSEDEEEEEEEEMEQ
ncbi:hypothetical protein IEO21_04492 [Rhodonia placenta]|uniref:Uncharacterized protein n=1 Tax=Rhodonia placenta TaxID=104341 RepID=A0A8H7P3L7_9APHY|nr:hypothetical protein IEO21_04492 [Postia placenta]